MNNIRDFFKKKKILLLKILIAVLAVSGLVLILFPIYTNIVVANKEDQLLSSWEELKEEKALEDQDVAILEDKDQTGVIDTEEDVEGPEETGQEEIENYYLEEKSYTVEDLFPLKIKIPEIELESIVNAGSDVETLKEGPGYILGTALPGEPGRVAISGHRTTYGAPFNRVDELERGDVIYLETLNGLEFEYVVKQQLVVEPQDIEVLEGDERPELLLTTCTPKFSASKRLIVVAELLDYYRLESYY